MRSTSLVSCIVVSAALIVLITGCDNRKDARDSELERILSTKLTQFKSGNTESLDLTSIVGSDWEKICIQGPYLDKERFERLAEKQVQSYEPQADDVYVFWVFYKDGTAKWARVKRVEIMDSHPTLGTPCTVPEYPMLYAAGFYENSRGYYLHQGVK